MPKSVVPPRALLGMVHVGALPGSPFSRRGVRELAARAAVEASLLMEAGFDGVLVENMHDRPYVQPPHSPATVAAMTLAADRVRASIGSAVMGVQVLSCGERESLSIALAVGAQFIRCENFVYSHVADEGLLERAAAGALLRYRREIGAESIRIFADIKKKHASHALTADLSLADCVHGAEFFGADGVIITGAFTGAAASPDDVRQAREATKLPVLIGSGVSPEQVNDLLRDADALIVGSWIKKGGRWENPVDKQRARAIVRARTSRAAR